MKKKMPVGKRFEPGNHYGKGRPILPEDLKAIKKMNQDEAERLILKFMGMTADEVLKMINDPATPFLHLMLCRMMTKATEYGDTQRLNFLFDRTIGRVLDKVEVSSPEPFVIRRPSGDIVLGVKDEVEEE